MSKKRKNKFIEAHAGPHKKTVDSLLDVMQDGNEYGNLVGFTVPNLSFREELRRGMLPMSSILPLDYHPT